MPWSCSASRASRPPLKTLKDSPRTGESVPEGFVQFVREHHVPSFLEYGEYPFVTADEVKKALTLKAAFSTMLDQMQ